MSLSRVALLRASRSRWLARALPRRAFVRRAVRRFMPGERSEDALRAAAALAREGIGTLYTHLGENVTSAAEAAAELAHYEGVIARVRELGLPACPSIKPTHLGLDVDPAACERHLLMLAARAADAGTFLWIDMEDARYTEATLRLYRHARARHPRVGVCLQAYLRRTPADLEALLPLAPSIRLVKGAYMEAASIAHPHKRDVDEAYFALGARLLEAAGDGRALPVFGTHDMRLIERLRQHAEMLRVAPGAYEFHMLYGIGTDDQRALTASGEKVRVLISYGEEWFPWYMRRLAERPANIWFVLRNLF